MTDPKDKTDGARWEEQLENLYGNEEKGEEKEEGSVEDEDEEEEDE